MGCNTDFGRWGWFGEGGTGGGGVGEGPFCRISICIFGHMSVQVKQNPLGLVFTAHSELSAVETSLKEWLIVFGQASVLRGCVSQALKSAVFSTLSGVSHHSWQMCVISRLCPSSLFPLCFWSFETGFQGNLKLEAVLLPQFLTHLGSEACAIIPLEL